jgi:hypothetical protein
MIYFWFGAIPKCYQYHNLLTISMNIKKVYIVVKIYFKYFQPILERNDHFRDRLYTIISKKK